MEVVNRNVMKCLWNGMEIRDLEEMLSPRSKRSACPFCGLSPMLRVLKAVHCAQIDSQALGSELGGLFEA